MAETTSGEAEGARPCPVGCGSLSTFTFRDVNLDHCLSCGGIWFDTGECPKLEVLPEGMLDSLDEMVTPAGVPSGKREGAGRDCPSCGVMLSPYSYHVGQVVTVDRCDLCDGFWADHGEISAINDSLIARAHGPVPPHLIDATRLGQHPSVSGRLSDDHVERGHVFQAFAAWLKHRGTS